jgi:hypothetical protein
MTGAARDDDAPARATARKPDGRASMNLVCSPADLRVATMRPRSLYSCSSRVLLFEGGAALPFTGGGKGQVLGVGPEAQFARLACGARAPGATGAGEAIRPRELDVDDGVTLLVVGGTPVGGQTGTSEA